MGQIGAFLASWFSGGMSFAAKLALSFFSTTLPINQDRSTPAMPAQLLWFGW
jgi:hypothetical protein